MQPNLEIKLFIIVTTLIVFLLAILIISLLYVYRKKQLDNRQRIDSMKLDYEKALLKTQIEVQEQTFQHMSREIHDNINLSLTLAKLNLNTLDWGNIPKIQTTIKSSIDTLGTAITDLSNLSKSTSTETIKNLGLLNAIKLEIEKIRFTKKFIIDFRTTGDSVFLDSEKELVIFRIIQEAFNNAIKHSNATNVNLTLNFKSDHLKVVIDDNGKGFEPAIIHLSSANTAAGLKNMYTRTKLFGGQFELKSKLGMGTKITFKLPYQHEQ